MEKVNEYIDFEQPSLYIATASILFNPLFWNTAARLEYNYHILTKLAFGNRYLGCYLLAATIFSLGIFRDHLYQVALEHQPSHPLLGHAEFKILAAVLYAAGGTLVLTSMWALGVTGTYLGDYFGILMEDRVTSFPFNVTDNPMYWGSAICFLATAIWYEKPAGIPLTLIVYLWYKVALTFEEPFTGAIYAERDAKRAAESKRAQANGSSSALSTPADASKRRTRKDE